MSELVNDYFQPGWRTRTVECAACEWRGDSRDMTLEPHEDFSEYLCPRCEDIMLVVRHPDLAQVRAAAAAGHAEAQEQLALLQAYLDRPDRER
ncbi:hypothetical protein [Pseudoxanthomonas daejeonensis]|uniref:Uncharacterized protein n=1 Tax=Pseudoxanthomonas daejeonensis TaxID=266062 RepID=A0ABQ6Z6M3_9GAMM|nr:hypothetical protein [Pseudoxanthomonas daejeonensis]KAF1693803.1 hypothetical protein CSC65_11000 [Pseudoxanthomonas daejeonensis]